MTGAARETRGLQRSQSAGIDSALGMLPYRYARPLLNSTYIAPVPPSRGGVEQNASTSSHWRSQWFTLVLSTGPLDPEPRPLPCTIRTHLMFRRLQSAIKSRKQSWASETTSPCRSISSCTANLPRRSWRMTERGTCGRWKASDSPNSMSSVGGRAEPSSTVDASSRRVNRSLAGGADDPRWRFFVFNGCVPLTDCLNSESCLDLLCLPLRSLAMRGSCFHAPAGELFTIYPESMRLADPIITFSLGARITAVLTEER